MAGGLTHRRRPVIFWPIKERHNMKTQPDISKWWRALPFAISLALVPLIVGVAQIGGWWLWLVPLCAWMAVSVVDLIIGHNITNPDPSTPRGDLRWYRAITLIWFPVQMALMIWLIWYVTRHADFGTGEKILLFFGMGVISGTVGINYAHELMHQPTRLERWLADLLLANVLYSHFRSEHMLVHHRHVGTARDAVTARYNEGFHRFFPRVLYQSPISAFRAEAAMLRRQGKAWYHIKNPFWRYGMLQLGMVGIALAIGGVEGVFLFAYQAFIAIWQLELANYIEHYGLTRRHLGDGQYEPTQPHHSWNATQRVSNWLLINLQRHSDHHYKPDRPFALLQTYGRDQAPQLPFGYPMMTTLAMIPPLWRRVMNPKLRAWRKQFYPDITDWTAYNKAQNPLPKDR
jgi:alkane 1-monooxygenase